MIAPHLLHRARLTGFGLLVALMALSACTTVSDINAGAPAGVSAASGLVTIPLTAYRTQMQVTLELPDGEGPFPLVVINHGSDQSLAGRVRMRHPSFPGLSKWFLARGYAVAIPFRPGHGPAGSPYVEDQGSCADADYTGSGRRTANLIAAAITHFTADPRISPNRTIVVGTSAGGWGAMALAAGNPPGVRAYVSFSGGRGGRDRGRAGQTCAPDRLVAAAAGFGASARVPALWLYARNDSYFAPELSARMAAAYEGAGAPLTFVLLPPVGSEGHGLITAPPSAWEAPLAQFIDAL